MALESRPKAEVQNVQALRGVAALLVVLSHVGQYERDAIHGPHYLLPWIYVGPTGVDLFFAISGFIMVITNVHGFGRVHAPLTFLMRRFIRIFPIYWIVTAAVLIVQFKLHEFSYPRTQLVFALFLIPTKYYPPVGVAWSLVYELYFYYIFAVTLWFRRSAFAWLFALWLGLTIALNVALHGQSAVGPLVRTLASPFNVEFVLGVGIGLLTVKRLFLSPPFIAVVAVVWTSAALMYLTHIGGGYPGAPYGGWERFALAGLPLATLLYAAVGLELRGKVALPRVVCAFGNASYSLYLWHEFLASAYFRIFKPLGKLGGLPGHLLYLGTVLIFTVATSLLLYWVLEKPITMRLQRIWRQYSPGRNA